jgi:hypothetical protein
LFPRSNLFKTTQRKNWNTIVLQFCFF